MIRPREQTDVVTALAAQWRTCGIRPGDMVLLHSRARPALKRHFTDDFCGGVHKILESFKLAAGPDGTLLLPLFNNGFAHGEAFDIRSTPSRMGAITEAARLSPGVVRTGHPLYSFAAIGAKAHLFAGVTNTGGFGPDSPFATLLANHGKIAVLDLPDQNSMTFYHFVEECVGADYRYHKTFTGRYTDAAGVASDRTFSLYVRDLDRGVVTSVGRMEDLLWSEGHYSGCKPGEGCGLRVIAAERLYERTSRVIKEGLASEYLYETRASDDSPPSDLAAL